MSNTALITGASGGIGRDLACLHAENGGDVVAVARSVEPLAELKAELEAKHSIQVTVIEMDLGQPDAAENLFAKVEEAGIEIDVLINNAGFGGHGLFHERSWEEDNAMIQLNIVALSGITHQFVQAMVQRKRGKILNIASTAGFLPGPLQATYYATKAYVVSFSQAIAEELSDSNISVTALCPGPVDTGFAKRADAEGVEAFKNLASSREVAEIGYNAMNKGKLIAINDWKLSFLLNWVVPFLPRWTVLKLSRKTMTKTSRI